MKRTLLSLTLMVASAVVAAVATSFTSSVNAQTFDNSHASFTALLKKHVVVIDGGKSSQVRYAELQKDRALLKAYLATLSAVNETTFNAWSKPERMAFLINAYNAFTLELMLEHYPVKSIKDIGGTFDNRWKRNFFKLLGRDANLDKVEHEMLRKPGAYNDVRIHYGVNCASIGCPALREEAFTAAKLDSQLEQQATRFLSDRSRNRYANGKLEVSMIFNWFEKDWESSYTGFNGKTPAITSLDNYFARYAKLLADSPQDQQKIAEGKVRITQLDYDWSINDNK